MRRSKLLVSLVLLLPVLAWVYFSSPDVESRCSFMFRSEIQSPEDNIRLYYDIGSDFNEQDTVSRIGSRFEQWSFVSLALPAEHLKKIRLDPGNQAGNYYVKDLCIEGVRKKCFPAVEILENCRFSAFVSSVEVVDGDTLLIRSIGPDPYLEFELNMASIQAETGRASKVLYLIVGLIFYVLFLFLLFTKKQKLSISLLVLGGLLAFVYYSDSYVKTSWKFDFKSEIPSGLDRIQILYDQGGGYSERDSVTYAGYRLSDYSFVSLKVPNENLQRVRLDLGDSEGVYYIRNLCWEGVSKKCIEAKDILVNATPSADVTSLEIIDGNTLLIRSHGRDPYVEFLLNFAALNEEINQSSKGLFLLLSLCIYPVILFLLFQLIELIKSSWKVVSGSIYFFVFVGSLFFAFSTYEVLVLNFSNPWNISGLPSRLEYNPSSDIIRYLYILIFPLFSLSIVHLLMRFITVPESWRKRRSNSLEPFQMGARIAFIVLAVVFVGNAPPSLYSDSYFDDFHEGESLAPAIDIEHGKSPYEETLFVHGPLQDPYKAILGFKLFGKSISSMRAFDSLLHMAARLLFIIALFYLFGKRVDLLCIAFAILIFIHAIRYDNLNWIIVGRDIPLFLFLIASTKLFRLLKQSESVRNLREGLLVFGWSFLPIAAFAYSIDRGFYLGFCFFVLVFLITFVSPNLAKRYWMYSLAGVLTSVLVLGWSISFEYGAFFRFVFLELPRFKELMDGMEYDFTKFAMTVPVLFTAMIIFWLGQRFYSFDDYSGDILQKCRGFLAEFYIEITLCLVVVTFYRSALGRSDLPHIEYSTIMIYVTVLYIVIMRYGWASLDGLNAVGKRYVAFLTLALLIVAFARYRSHYRYDVLYRLPTGLSDSHLIPKGSTGTISFLRSDLGKDEYFFTMTNEASWYYFVDRPCPSRFSTVWFAMPPFYQKEIIDDLKASSVKYIIYKNNNWPYLIDGFTSEERLPILTEYIKEAYAPYKMIDANEIWIRKADNG